MEHNYSTRHWRAIVVLTFAVLITIVVSRETKIDDERYANPEGFKTEQKGLAGHKGAFTPGDDKNKETMWKKADYHEWVMTRAVWNCPLLKEFAADVLKIRIGEFVMDVTDVEWKRSDADEKAFLLPKLKELGVFKLKKLGVFEGEPTETDWKEMEIFIMMKFITMKDGMGMDIKLSQQTCQPSEETAVTTEDEKGVRMRQTVGDFDELTGLLDRNKMSKYSKMNLYSWTSSTNIFGFRIVGLGRIKDTETVLGKYGKRIWLTSNNYAKNLILINEFLSNDEEARVLLINVLIKLHNALACSELAHRTAFIGASAVVMLSADRKTIKLRFVDMNKVLLYESPAERPEIYTLHGLENVIRIAREDGDESLLRLGATHNDVIDSVHVLGLGNAEFRKAYAENLRTRDTPKPDLKIARVEDECADVRQNIPPRSTGKRGLEDDGNPVDGGNKRGKTG